MIGGESYQVVEKLGSGGMEAVCRARPEDGGTWRSRFFLACGWISTTWRATSTSSPGGGSDHPGAAQVITVEQLKMVVDDFIAIRTTFRIAAPSTPCSGTDDEEPLEFAEVSLLRVSRL